MSEPRPGPTAGRRRSAPRRAVQLGHHARARLYDAYARQSCIAGLLVGSVTRPLRSASMPASCSGIHGVGRYLGELMRAGPHGRIRRRAVRSLTLRNRLPLGFSNAGSAELRVVGRGTHVVEQTSLRRAVKTTARSLLRTRLYGSSRDRVPFASPFMTFVHRPPEWFRPRERFRAAADGACAADAGVCSPTRVFATELRRAPRGLAAHPVIPPRSVHGGQRPPRAACREPLVLFVGSLFNRRAARSHCCVRARHGRYAVSAPVIVRRRPTWPPQDLRAAAEACGAAAKIDLRNSADIVTLRISTQGVGVRFLSEYRAAA